MEDLKIGVEPLRELYVMKFVPAMWGEREKRRIRAKIARFDKISTR